MSDSEMRIGDQESVPQAPPSQEILTNRLRWLRRDGALVLQQQSVGNGGAGRYQWRDVPIVEGGK